MIGRAIAALAALVGSTASAQVSVGPNGVRSGSTVIDATGVHANGTDVTSSGVHVGRGGGTVIRTNGGHRTIDCGGGGLTLDGNSNHLAVRNCSAVTVSGNGNEADVAYAVDGRLVLMGNRNTVRWRASRRAHVAVSSMGSRNTVERR